jgi:hypothetical protein
MKKNTKMSSTKVSIETRISARVDNDLYLAMRFIATSQSKTIEEKIAELCKNEVAYVSKQKWFIELVENGSADNIIPLLDLLDKRKKIIKGMAKGKAALDSSDFDANDLNNDGGEDE